MGEKLKIFSDWMTPVGEKDRDEVHRDGDWHESFHCWFYRHDKDETFLYFQKRSDTKKEFPCLYDITAAGHIQCTEGRVEGGLREISEELGLQLSEKDIDYHGFYKEELRVKTLKDREICHIYLYAYDEAKTLTMNEEVTDVVRVNLEEFLSMISKNGKFVTAESLFHKESILMEAEDFCPHDFNYYQHIIQAIMSTR
ncbi:NUDIX domain-containing protein [Halobacillus sp. Marseille-Q1614]|uniref:NUDIX hydrolase n=1 Tax=Halobacillus sp. Marseille-Q1614 TaxID=2709134 RepID=UPI00156F5B92|nr:NUDIX domain-containing protein [Halobacillus sp. Marseille-Q1614]